MKILNQIGNKFGGVDATIIETDKGFKKTLFTPSGKAARYAEQLREKCVLETGEVLSAEQYGFRRGYLAARSDNADAYLAKNDPKKLKAKNAKRALYRKNAKNAKKSGNVFWQLNNQGR